MRLRPYLQLLRVPNLFTVPGDPLCGFLLAGSGLWSWRVLPALLVSLSAYCFGLVLNDLADLAEDTRDRPRRPLPSGAVGRRTALFLCVSLAVFAFGVSLVLGPPFSEATLLLLAAITLYDSAAKKSPVAGPVCMGFCRGLDVFLGALASGCLPLPSLFAWGFANPNPRLAWAALVRYLHTLAIVPPAAPLPLLAAAVVGFYIMGVSALARAEAANPRLPPLIGTLIRGLLFLQAAFCALSGSLAGWVAAGVLLALWPISRLVGKSFYAS